MTSSPSPSSPSSSPSPPKPPSPSGSKNIVQNIFFGGTAGVIGQTCVFPLYTIKTRLHLYPGRYTSIPNCARRIVAHDGLRGLYRGLLPALTGVFPEKAIKLSVNDYLAASLARPDGSVSVPSSMLAGAGAGLCQVVATNPMEMAMINMQSAAAQGRAGSLGSLVRRLGLRGLYKGTAATLFRDIPFSVVFFSMNSSLRTALTGNDGRLPMSKVFLAGIAAGSTAASLSTPMDVVKTRLQASAGDPAKSPEGASAGAGGRGKAGLGDAVRSGVRVSSATSRQFSTAAAGGGEGGQVRYTGIAQCARHIYATEGVRGFFAGVGPRVLIISPLFGITLFFYDIQRRLQESGKL